MRNYQGAMNGGGEKCSDACEKEWTEFQMDWMLCVRGKSQRYIEILT